MPDENEGAKVRLRKSPHFSFLSVFAQYSADFRYFGPDDSKIEIQQPDSTTESDQNSNVKSPPRARDDSMGSDSENQQPDSTTQEPKIEENQESKQEGVYKYIFFIQYI